MTKKKPFYKLSYNQEGEPETSVTPEQVGKFIGIYLMGPLLFMICWNGVLPYLFAIKTINYIHAFCIITMIRFLKLK